MISYRHRVIFVHIPKCAGQSIEHAFLRDVGLDWEARHPLLLRPRQEGERGPERLAHLYASEYIKFGYISEAEFRAFFKFSVVRDPIDRMISELNWREVGKGASSAKSVEEYVSKVRRMYAPDSDIVRHLEPQINFLFDEKMGGLLVDKVVNLNDLKNQFETIKSSYECTNLQLTHKNASESKTWSRQRLSQADLEFLHETYWADYDFIATLC